VDAGIEKGENLIERYAYLVRALPHSLSGPTFLHNPFTSLPDLLSCSTFLLLQGNLFNLLSLLQEAVSGTMIDVFSDKKQTRKFVLFINGRSWVAIKERTSSIDKFSQQRAPLLLLLLLLLFFSSASNSPSLSLSALKQLLSTD